MRLLSGLVNFSERKNLQNELRCSTPTDDLRHKSTVCGTKRQWILPERENWSYTPGDSLLSNRQRLFEYEWDELITLPSRLSAEAPDRQERQRLFGNSLIQMANAMVKRLANRFSFIVRPLCFQISVSSARNSS
jgi:hypothetical protein